MGMFFATPTSGIWDSPCDFEIFFGNPGWITGEYDVETPEYISYIWARDLKEANEIASWLNGSCI
jgi:hypothetical protein